MTRPPFSKSGAGGAAPEGPAALNTAALTWAALLGAWVDYARSAVAYPDSQAGHRMRASVPDVIQLQAVWFALQHLSELAPQEQALGVDRAGVLVERHARTLRERFAVDPMPALMLELIQDTEALLMECRARRAAGV